MQRETQAKAIAGAVAALVASFVPLLMSFTAGIDYTPEQFAEFKGAVGVLATAVTATFVGWAGVYFAPRNKPIPEE